MEELQKILETAEGMFRKYGIRSVTMSDISKQLGISKKTLYIHIQNKRDLISKILAVYIDREREIIKACRADGSDALDEMLRVSIQVQENIKNINPSILFDLRKYHYPIWEQFDLFRKSFMLDAMQENMVRGISEGIYRADLDPDVISRIYISTVEIFADDEIFPAENFPRSALYRQMVIYHLNGITSEKGKKLLNNFLKLSKDGINQ